MDHVMIDLETLDTVPTAAIVSIGAVLFDPARGTLGREFYVPVALKSCTDAGLTVSASTVAWWMGQSDAARRVFADTAAVSLADALGRLRMFIPDRARLWAHGPSFDLVILENACRAVKTPSLGGHREQRCTRTVYDLAKVNLKGFDAGTHHNALDDAKNQARAVCEAYRRLGLA